MADGSCFGITILEGLIVDVDWLTDFLLPRSILSFLCVDRDVSLGIS